MRDLFAGATNYKNQADSEIVRDLTKMIQYSKDIMKNNKKLLASMELPMDLRWIFREIILFAEKLIEISRKNTKKTKRGYPTLFFCQTLKEMGIDAHNLNLKIGEIWHSNIYGAKYNLSSIESNRYEELRNYIISMMDLNNIGHELEKRYFRSGKPLYEKKDWWRYTRDLIEIFANAIVNFFKKSN